MRIISKYQDYYDCGLAYGVDTDLYFKRTKEELGDFIPIRYFKTRAKSKYSFEGSVSFCGKRYPFAVVVTSKDKPIEVKNISSVTCDYNFCYDMESFEEAYPKNKKKYYRHTKPEYFRVVDVDIEEFKKRNAPYFTMTNLPNPSGIRETEYTTETNLPILKNFQFNKVFPPYEAFQEISMFLGAMKINEPECEIDEKYRKAGHGMDCTSFRNTKRDC